MLAAGALAAAGAAALTDNLLLQGILFAVVAALGVVFVRPTAARHLRAGPSVPMGMEALEGASAQVLQRVAEHEGLVRINGEDWTARSFDTTQVIEPGDRARVMQIKGATALVWKEP
jgi:membrane protein implicated in regulation of membrane protease activity